MPGRGAARWVHGWAREPGQRGQYPGVLWAKAQLNARHRGFPGHAEGPAAEVVRPGPLPGLACVRPAAGGGEGGRRLR